MRTAPWMLVAGALLIGCQEATQPDSEPDIAAKTGTVRKIEVTDLGILGGYSSVGGAINPAGQVVGSSETAEYDLHAFLWSRGTMTDLGTGIAAGINAAGQVVGWAPRPPFGAAHAVLWTIK